MSVRRKTAQELKREEERDAVMPEELREWSLVVRQHAGCREECVVSARKETQFGGAVWVIHHARQDGKGEAGGMWLAVEMLEDAFDGAVFGGRDLFQRDHLRWYSEPNGSDR